MPQVSRAVHPQEVVVPLYKRILVPVDGSARTHRAIHVSVELAQQLHAELVGFVAGPVRATPRANEADDDVLTARRARSVLARFERAAQAEGVPFEGVYVRVPLVPRAILAAAESHRCDMIVMVTRGRGAFGEFLFGSQTKAVLAASRLPLLVLH
ncbi:MAG: universal stress protein [Rubrivivax sp.]|nr:universal stress protein [Rubrivivax sp.]